MWRHLHTILWLTFGYIKLGLANAKSGEDFEIDLDDLVESLRAAEVAQSETDEMIARLRRVRAATAQRE